MRFIGLLPVATLTTVLWPLAVDGAHGDIKQERRMFGRFRSAIGHLFTRNQPTTKDDTTDDSVTVETSSDTSSVADSVPVVAAHKAGPRVIRQRPLGRTYNTRLPEPSPDMSPVEELRLVINRGGKSVLDYMYAGWFKEDWVEYFETITLLSVEYDRVRAGRGGITESVRNDVFGAISAGLRFAISNTKDPIRLNLVLVEAVTLMRLLRTLLTDPGRNAAGGSVAMLEARVQSIRQLVERPDIPVKENRFYTWVVSWDRLKHAWAEELWMDQLSFMAQYFDNLVILLDLYSVRRMYLSAVRGKVVLWDEIPTDPILVEMKRLADKLHRFHEKRVIGNEWSGEFNADLKMSVRRMESITLANSRK